MSKKKKKKVHHEEHVDESWLVPYADILTLLLALFIVLYGMSSVDAKKFSEIAEAFNRELQGGTGIFEYPSPAPSMNSETTDVDLADQEKKEDKKDKKNLSEKELKELQEQQDKQELLEIQQKVNAYIAKNKLGNKLDTELTDEGLHVSIRDNVLFASGSAEVRNKDRKVVSEIANLLVMDPPRSIIISGHTDNVPISNSSYESNWELSVTRALNFMKLLLENKKLDPKSFSAKGYGEFQPIASNDSSAGRAKNRRVDILIEPRVAKED
ncbi:flagellar motor protein MotB [Niallia circulans]|jgi:chemotaxis protein MotB|uniref:flagellar motor protein MotB n=1 Tax=Niallia TaxID=2837506 RepID=UPI000BA52C9E|nr:flagellar motor protein MotB [Niallia circulans]MCM2981579.1 flagellar motor protein MotB [Niallia circulans]PAD24122.1 flagellar motor protein MotB [Niallia circulans]PAD87543.1 flagellar motor protein MotB [Niallia circulans]PAE11257.1 flagellar motor protein MotB [Niallia circulans]